ncbi:MAG: GNAT family N-acetyltransferase [Pseudomonadota bacterium]
MSEAPGYRVPEQLIRDRGEDWILVHPIPPELEAEVGAFSARRRISLRRIIGDRDQREKMLSSPIRPDRIAAILIDGRVIGCLSYRVDGKGSIMPRIRSFWREYGLVSGTSRWIGTELTLRRGRPDELYVEGFAVASEARGMRLGSALLKWLSGEVIRLGKSAWRTEMPDGHHEAARAYERSGARRERIVPMGPFAAIIGSKAMTLYRWTPPGT